MNVEANQPNVKNAGHLVITDAMDPYHKVQYALGEIVKK